MVITGILSNCGYGLRTDGTANLSGILITATRAYNICADYDTPLSQLLIDCKGLVVMVHAQPDGQAYHVTGIRMVNGSQRHLEIVKAYSHLGYEQVRQQVQIIVDA